MLFILLREEEEADLYGQMANYANLPCPHPKKYTYIFAATATDDLFSYSSSSRPLLSSAICE